MDTNTTDPQNAGASNAATTPVAGANKGYRLDPFLPPEQAQHLEALAAHYGHTLPQFLERLIILQETVKEIICLKCHQPQKQLGVFPEIPNRPPNDAYETMLSVRLLRNRWLEIKPPGEREPKYICSYCVSLNLQSVKMALKALAMYVPGFAIDNEFLDELLNRAAPKQKALGSAKK